MINLEEKMTIQILYQQGMSKKRIARKLGISINTVRKYLRPNQSLNYRTRSPKPMKLDPYRDYILKRLEAAKPHWIPATVIFREITDLGYAGGISTLRHYMRQQKPSLKEEPIVRFETAPGQQMQIDWAEFKKKPDRLSAFIATLGYSRMSYVEFVNNEILSTLLQCHENAFHYFGGVPREILYDNMKTVIIERHAYGTGKHRLQSGFWDFSKHYGFIPRVCRPYRAQTKGKVERFIRYLRYSFYHPLLSELKILGYCIDPSIANEKVLLWLNDVANQRIHQTTKKIPKKELLKEELQPLPPPYRGVQPVMKEEDEKQKSLMNYADFSTIDLQHDLSYYDDLLGG